MPDEPINTLDSARAEQPQLTASGAMAPEGWKPFCYIVAAALLVRLWFNFGAAHVNAFNSCDASEYIRYTTALSQLVSGQAAQPMSQVLKEFVITGPALPVFLLLTTIFTGKPFDPSNSTPDLVAQSIISALTAGLIYLMARRLYDNRSALYAGIIAVIYPAFIVNSGRLYSETFATFAECAAIALIVSGFFPQKNYIAANIGLGISLVVCQLTRSAMVLLTAVAMPVVFLQGLSSGGTANKNWRQAFIRLAFVLGGALLVLGPWLIFEKAAYNKMTLAVDRVGHYNLFIGTNTSTQGFLSYPYPDGHGIEEHSFPSLIARAYHQSPAHFIRLIMDKPARLLKAPWNDFRCPIGPIDYKLQVAIHEAILLLSIIGILIACFVEGPPASGQEDREDKREKDLENELQIRKVWGRCTLLLAFALNLPYLAFITVPRYNLTAMPFLIIFAGAGLQTIIVLLKNYPFAKAPKALILFALCLFIFLRDDLRDIFVFGQEPMANLVLVQGHDFIVKGLISVAFGLGLFLSIAFCLPLLKGNKKVAASLTAILALLAAPLLALPQRANGRPGEGIFTLERKGECLTGKIPVVRSAPGQGTVTTEKAPTKDRAAAEENVAAVAADTSKAENMIEASNGAEESYLLIDAEDPTLLNGQVDLTINGEKIKGPLIPGISALDDWHYLKQRGQGVFYLECSYIYDCMTGPAAQSNLDLRQWFYVPVSPAFMSEARRRGCLDVTISHKVDQSTKLFTASLTREHAIIPSRNIYSWEKCFYGVENDSGLTDSRYDEKVPLRQAKWKMNFGKSSEDLANFDLNLRLITLKVPTAAADQMARLEGMQDVVLPLDQSLVKTGLMTLVEVSLNKDKDNNKNNANSPSQSPPQPNNNAPKLPPQLALQWIGKNGGKNILPLPWLKNTSDNLDIAVPLAINQIEGSQFAIKVHSDDSNCKIKLAARPIFAHPVFDHGVLF